MNTELFDYEVLLAATILLASAILIASILLLAHLLKEWARENVGSRRRPEAIEPGEGFFFYEHGHLRYDICDRNHTDIGVIYTLLNRRVEYKNVSKL